MYQVNIARFRKELSHYLDRVQNGEEIGITRHGKVIATLTPKVKSVDLSDMADLDEELGLFDESNAVVEARTEYRY